ncbi:unnamed protein product [Cunninghamella blakesleeana]
MSNAIVSNVYRYVIDDVINQVRGEFEDMGIDESVLRELQRSWETKVARSRVANFGFNGDEYYDEESEQSNANTQNEGHYSEQYSQNAPTAANLATIGNATVRTQTQPNNANKIKTENNVTALPSNVNSNNNNNNNNTNNTNNPLKLPQPQPQSQQHPPPTLPSITSPQQQLPYNLPHLPPVNGGNQFHQMLHPTALSSPNPPHHQQPPTLPDLQLPGGSNRPHLPQNDGLNDTMTTEEIDAHLEQKIMKVHEQQSQNKEDEIIFSATTYSGERLSLEQLPDHIKLLMKDARERAIQAGAISSKSRIGQLDGDNDNPTTPANNNNDATKNTGNDDDINSDLDDSDESDDEAKGGEEIEHIILCLYDKVTRTKNKWKCVLKDGIMLVNGRDYLFHRANGDFEW